MIDYNANGDLIISETGDVVFSDDMTSVDELARALVRLDVIRAMLGGEIILGDDDQAHAAAQKMQDVIDLQNIASNRVSDAVDRERRARMTW